MITCPPAASPFPTRRRISTAGSTNLTLNWPFGAVLESVASVAAGSGGGSDKEECERPRGSAPEPSEHAAGAEGRFRVGHWAAGSVGGSERAAGPSVPSEHAPAGVDVRLLEDGCWAEGGSGPSERATGVGKRLEEGHRAVQGAGPSESWAVGEAEEQLMAPPLALEAAASFENPPPPLPLAARIGASASLIPLPPPLATQPAAAVSSSERRPPNPLLAARFDAPQLSPRPGAGTGVRVAAPPPLRRPSSCLYRQREQPPEEDEWEEWEVPPQQQQQHKQQQQQRQHQEQAQRHLQQQQPQHLQQQQQQLVLQAGAAHHHHHHAPPSLLPRWPLDHYPM